MRANTNLFWLLTAFFGLSAVVYTGWNLLDDKHIVEWVGTTALLLSTALGAFLAFYLGRVYKNQGGELPEDTLTANIDDGDPELGHFSPWSWWPIFLAGAIALVFLGVAVGPWIAFIGLPLVLIAIVGWCYEYYRGYFVR